MIGVATGASGRKEKTMNLSISGYGSSAAQFDPSQMKAQMQQKLDQLKKTDPELASKMEKIGAKMDQARTSGTDPKTAMQSIKSEFGEFSDKELGELKSLGLGGRPGGRMQGPPPSGARPGIGGVQSKDDMESTLLKALTESDDSDSDKSSKSSNTSNTSSTGYQKLLANLTKKYSSSATTTSFGSIA